MTRKLRARLAAWLLPRLQARASAPRPPDFVIGFDYCRRWWIIPRNRWFNIYFHRFLHSDDDRALHDHPWWNMSFLLKGEYVEYLETDSTLTHEPTRRVLRRAGDVVFRLAGTPHRVELQPRYELTRDGMHPTDEIEECWTLFVTGPVIREWGFHCPGGWRHWKDFVAPSDKGQIGKGCD